jgi:hypothetical protein
VRSDLIVFLSPLGNQYLGFGQRREDLPVEQFVPQFAVERLDIAILPGAARFDEEGFDTQSGQPFAYLPGGELRTVIGANVLRLDFYSWSISSASRQVLSSFGRCKSVM